MRPASLLDDRFRGALIGVLVGDCIGVPYELVLNFSSNEIANTIKSLVNGDAQFLEDQPPKSTANKSRYEPFNRKQFIFSDDTAMTKTTCQSLIQHKRLDPKHLAKLYAEDYFRDSKRGYGGAVVKVFEELRSTNYKDPYGPAKKQFGGLGSFGNGVAMRCSGLALFAHKMGLNDVHTMSLVDDCSRITHCHRYGILGAKLIVFAYLHVLSLSEDSLNELDFLDRLIVKMSDIEASDDQMYTNKLKHIKRVVEQLSVHGIDTNQRELVEALGNDVAAQNSVPIAIYSFLRGCSKFTDSYDLDNEFVRTLHWAISCGGDTDTIASMACGLSGAYFGLSKIPEKLYQRCESWKEMLSLADSLAKL